jgi:predicted RND superfamily exporter protein
MLLALMQAAAKLAALLTVIVGLATFAARPQESIGCVAVILVLGMIARFPIAALFLVAALALAVQLRKRRRGEGRGPSEGRPTKS